MSRVIPAAAAALTVAATCGAVEKRATSVGILDSVCDSRLQIWGWVARPCSVVACRSLRLRGGGADANGCFLCLCVCAAAGLEAGHRRWGATHTAAALKASTHTAGPHDPCPATCVVVAAVLCRVHVCLCGEGVCGCGVCPVDAPSPPSPPSPPSLVCGAQRTVAMSVSPRCAATVLTLIAFVLSCACLGVSWMKGASRCRLAVDPLAGSAHHTCAAAPDSVHSALPLQWRRR
jgi:hypothetical protein